MMNEYRTIINEAEGLYKDRGSKFYGYLTPVRDREEALEYLNKIKELHKKARHHCFAWRIGPEGEDYRISDDGEPSGSAGQPIFNQLLSFDVTNVLAIVVRYFGGTKLGVPGLINAYRTATTDAFNNVQIVTKQRMVVYRIIISYLHADKMLSTLKKYDINLLKSEYSNSVSLEVEIPFKNHVDNIKLALTNCLELPSVEMLDTVDESEIHFELISMDQ